MITWYALIDPVRKRDRYTQLVRSTLTGCSIWMSHKGNRPIETSKQTCPMAHHFYFTNRDNVFLWSLDLFNTDASFKYFKAIIVWSNGTPLWFLICKWWSLWWFSTRSRSGGSCSGGRWAVYRNSRICARFFSRTGCRASRFPWCRNSKVVVVWHMCEKEKQRPASSSRSSLNSTRDIAFFYTKVASSNKETYIHHKNNLKYIIHMQFLRYTDHPTFGYTCHIVVWSTASFCTFYHLSNITSPSLPLERSYKAISYLM